MIKIIIKDNQNNIIGRTIIQENEVESFLLNIIQNNVFGKPEHTKISISEDLEEVIEIVPSEYIIEQIDITAELEETRLNIENERVIRKNRIDSLSSIDWTAVTTIAHCKNVMKIIIAEILKEEI